jgi:hypothetical protein
MSRDFDDQLRSALPLDGAQVPHGDLRKTTAWSVHLAQSSGEPRASISDELGLARLT